MERNTGRRAAPGEKSEKNKREQRKDKENEMKITLKKSLFLEKLQPAMGTVSNKNTITSIEGVLIETLPNGRIQISTYDMNKGVRATLDAVSIEREGKFIINAQRLYQTVRVMPEDEITIEINDKLNCTIYSGKASFSLYAMNGADFPNFPELVTDRGFTISPALLRKMIGKVIHSVSDQDSRPMLCGAYFEISDDMLEVVSCDSYTLSRCTYKCELGKFGAKDDKLSFIIPGAALLEIMKIFPDDDEKTVKVYLSRKHAIVSGEDIIFFTRMIDSEYIDYNRVIPKDNDVSVTVDRESFLGSLERANIIAEEKIQGSGRSYVKLSIEGQFFDITSASVNGKVYEELDCVHEGPDLKIGFNCRYLINSVKAAEGENIHITMKGPTQAMLIEPCERDERFDYLYMILPVRMNEG